MPEQLSPKDHAESVALFRAQVIAPLMLTELNRGELKDALLALAQTNLLPPAAKVRRTYAVSTLERWYYDYRKGGIDGLRPARRRDRGAAQGLSPQQRQLLVAIRRENPRASVPLILRTLEAEGRLQAGIVGEATVRRLFLEHGVDRTTLRREGKTGRVRRRWEAAAPGVLWHSDVCHGPALKVQGASVPLRIHAILDDASRYILAIQACDNEQEVEMLKLVVRALRLHPAPGTLYLDNGSTYSGEVLPLTPDDGHPGTTIDGHRVMNALCHAPMPTVA